MYYYLKKGDIMVSVDEFPISTTNDLPGFKIIETKGFVYGLTVRSRGVGGKVGANVKSLVGGEIKQYVSMMEETRGVSINKCISHCKEIGGNAIISMRLDSDSISINMQEVLAYGTAVVVEKE